MALLDCFIELIAYVGYLNKGFPDQQPPYERVKSDIAGLIRKSAECGAAYHSDGNDYDLARFAVLAWIDEVILNSAWREKQHWQSEQLQRVHYQTADAGELFFDRLNELQPHQMEVREVYYLCLAMGFTGRYCNPGDEFLLNQLKASNLKLLVSGVETTRDLAGGKLFPEAYSDGTAVDFRGKRRFFGMGTLVLGSIPVLFLVLLFCVYRFVLSNVGTDLISSIR